jgi:hypothetical protein
MDELEREVKIYGEVDRIMRALKDIEGVPLESHNPINDAINTLSIMRDELRRSDLTIKDLKAGVK